LKQKYGVDTIPTEDYVRLIAHQKDEGFTMHLALLARFYRAEVSKELRWKIGVHFY
jgi:hypothetical protein